MSPVKHIASVGRRRNLFEIHQKMFANLTRQMLRQISIPSRGYTRKAPSSRLFEPATLNTSPSAVSTLNGIIELYILLLLSIKIID